MAVAVSAWSEEMIHRLATCSMGSASARRCISAGSWMFCFCSGVSESAAQKRVFSRATSRSAAVSPKVWLVSAEAVFG